MELLPGFVIVTVDRVDEPTAVVPNSTVPGVTDIVGSACDVAVEFTTYPPHPFKASPASMMVALRQNCMTLQPRTVLAPTGTLEGFVLDEGNENIGITSNTLVLC